MISEELAGLVKLRDEGVLTEQEFAHQKAILLASTHRKRSNGCTIALAVVGGIFLFYLLVILGFISLA